MVDSQDDETFNEHFMSTVTSQSIHSPPVSTSLVSSMATTVNVTPINSLSQSPSMLPLYIDSHDSTIEYMPVVDSQDDETFNEHSMSTVTSQSIHPPPISTLLVSSTTVNVTSINSLSIVDQFDVQPSGADDIDGNGGNYGNDGNDDDDWIEPPNSPASSSDTSTTSQTTCLTRKRVTPQKVAKYKTKRPLKDGTIVKETTMSMTQQKLFDTIYKEYIGTLRSQRHQKQQKQKQTRSKQLLENRKQVKKCINYVNPSPSSPSSLNRTASVGTIISSVGTQADIKVPLYIQQKQIEKYFAKIVNCCGGLASDQSVRRVSSDHPLMNIIRMVEYRLTFKAAKRKAWRTYILHEVTASEQRRLNLPEADKIKCIRPFIIDGVETCPDCFFHVHGYDKKSYTRYRKRVQDHHAQFVHRNTLVPKKRSAVVELATTVLANVVYQNCQYQPDEAAVQLPQNTQAGFFDAIREVKYY